MSRDILQQIVDATREDLAREQPNLSEAKEAAEERRRGRNSNAFATALRGGRNALADGRPARIIAEVKSASPSAGTIIANPEVEMIAGSYRQGGAAAISVVTEPRFFKGSREWIQRAHEATRLPVIMKDFVVEPVQLYRGVAAGADAILLLASLLDRERLREFITILDEMGVDALVEVHDERELKEAIGGGAQIIGVNNRDLRNFTVSLATSERVVQSIPSGTIRVSESGISCRSDVERLLEAGYDAFLVGESLLKKADQSEAVRSLALASGV